jgi:hypothetical protein
MLARSHSTLDVHDTAKRIYPYLHITYESTRTPAHLRLASFLSTFSSMSQFSFTIVMAISPIHTRHSKKKETRQGCVHPLPSIYRCPSLHPSLAHTKHQRKKMLGPNHSRSTPRPHAIRFSVYRYLTANLARMRFLSDFAYRDSTTARSRLARCLSPYSTRIPISRHLPPPPYLRLLIFSPVSVQHKLLVEVSVFFHILYLHILHCTSNHELLCWMLPKSPSHQSIPTYNRVSANHTRTFLFHLSIFRSGYLLVFLFILSALYSYRLIDAVVVVLVPPELERSSLIDGRHLPHQHQNPTMP